MYVKADFASTINGQHLIHQPQKFSAVILQQPAVKLILNMGQATLASLAVFSGLDNSPENLEMMGIYLGHTYP